MDKKPETPAADLAAREKMLDNRTVWMKAHDSAAAQRDAAIADREEIVRLREAQLEARREVDTARAERERLLVQIREINEKLVLASLRAEEAAEDANAARVVADDNAERFRSLVLTLSAVVWRATPEGRVDVDRDAWRKLTGGFPTPDEWGWLEAVHPIDRERVRDAWTDAVVGTKAYACEHRIRSRKGGYAWVMARAVPIVRAGVVREWIGMLSDVSDRVRVEEARDQFIGILGHDLRNPLASIVAGTELLRAVPDPFAATVTRVARSAHRIDAIIRDLLDFARGRLGGGIPIVTRPCDMRLICDEVVDEIRLAHPDRSIRFVGTGDLRGVWDPDRVEQLLSNLLGNAVMHGADPITVTCRADGHLVVTDVQNQGPPIPEAIIPTLFEPFTRATDARDGHRGLGLGLFIASEIARAHAGTLTVSSGEDHGTTFTCVLPRVVPRRARTTTDEQPIVSR